MHVYILTHEVNYLRLLFFHLHFPPYFQSQDCGDSSPHRREEDGEASSGRLTQRTKTRDKEHCEARSELTLREVNLISMSPEGDSIMH